VPELESGPLILPPYDCRSIKCRREPPGLRQSRVHFHLEGFSQHLRAVSGSGIFPTGSGANGSGPSVAWALRSVSPRWSPWNSRRCCRWSISWSSPKARSATAWPRPDAQGAHERRRRL